MYGGKISTQAQFADNQRVIQARLADPVTGRIQAAIQADPRLQAAIAKVQAKSAALAGGANGPLAFHQLPANDPDLQEANAAWAANPAAAQMPPGYYFAADSGVVAKDVDKQAGLMALGAFAAPLALGFAGAGAVAGGGGGAATTAGTGATATAGGGAATGTYGPMAGGYAGLGSTAATTAAVPASLAAGTGAATTASGIGTFLGSKGGQFAVGTAANIAGSYLENKAADDRNQENIALQQQLTQAGREDSSKKAMADYLSTQQSQERADNLSRDQGGVSATQLDPYAAAKAQNAAQVRYSYGQNLNPSTGFLNAPVDMSALNPQNLQKSADNFYSNVAQLQPNVDLTAQSPVAEQARQQKLKDLQAQKAAIEAQIQQFLGGIGGPIKQPLPSLNS